VGYINTETWYSRLNMVTSPAELGSVNDCAGEDQQQFNKRRGNELQSRVYVCVWEREREWGWLVSECPLEESPVVVRPLPSPLLEWVTPFQNTYISLGENKNMVMGSDWGTLDPKLRLAVLARTSSSSTDRTRPDQTGPEVSWLWDGWRPATTLAGEDVGID
jgi:hypothetical protein